MAAFLKFDACEGTMNRELQRWNMDLGQVHVDFPHTVDAAHVAAINDRQSQLRCEQSIDTAFLRTGVDQSLEIRNSGVRRRVVRSLPGRIESEAHPHGGTVISEKLCTLNRA